MAKMVKMLDEINLEDQFQLRQDQDFHVDVIGPTACKVHFLRATLTMVRGKLPLTAKVEVTPPNGPKRNRNFGLMGHLSHQREKIGFTLG